MLGKPKFEVGEFVEFEIDGHQITGIVYIVDKYGTFFIDDEVCYDIFAQFDGKVNEDGDVRRDVLYKHIRESALRLKK